MNDHMCVVDIHEYDSREIYISHCAGTGLRHKEETSKVISRTTRCTAPRDFPCGRFLPRVPGMKAWLREAVLGRKRASQQRLCGSRAPVKINTGRIPRTYTCSSYAAKPTTEAGRAPKRRPPYARNSRVSSRP